MDWAVSLRQFAAAMMPVIFSGAAIFAGLLIIANSLRKMATMGDARSSEQATWGGVGFGLLIGAMLLQFSSTMNDVSDLLFGTPIQDVRGVLAYVDASGGGRIGPWRAVLEAVLMWIVLLGWISAFRGFLKWNQAANGQSQGGSDPFWSGLWHIIGGAAAINLGGIVNSFFR